MKAMSKFFLIISGILIGVGAIICVIGLVLAKNEGVQLYDEKKDGNYIYTVDLDGTSISKISINATDADITVYTGQEKEYIEFINFNETYGSVSSTNTVVSFDEYVNFSSLLSFWDGGFTFKGMHSLLDFHKAPSGSKEVNIYLSDERNINVFSFTIEKGTISFDNIASNTDYKLSVDDGTVKMKNISTPSKLYLKATSCSAIFENCSFESFIGDVGDLTLSGSIDIGSEFSINAKRGTIDADIGLSEQTPSFSIQTSGSIIIDGESYPGVYKSTDTSENKDDSPENINVSVTGDTLNVSLRTKKQGSDKINAEQ